MTDEERLVELLEQTGMLDNKTRCKIAAAELLANDVTFEKQGEWKIHQNNEYWHYDCPFCDDGYATKGQDKTPPNYCGNCGAKLKELNKNVNR